MNNNIANNETVIYLDKVSKIYKVKKKSNLNILKRIFKHKTYENVIAIDNVSFKISKGEFIGLVGNNGAGKSTLVKMMTGILYNSSGNIQVLGNDPYKKRLDNNLNSQIY